MSEEEELIRRWEEEFLKPAQEEAKNTVPVDTISENIAIGTYARAYGLEGIQTMNGRWQIEQQRAGLMRNELQYRDVQIQRARESVMNIVHPDLHPEMVEIQEPVRQMSRPRQGWIRRMWQRIFN
jgi:hypothetical protein